MLLQAQGEYLSEEHLGQRIADGPLPEAILDVLVVHMDDDAAGSCPERGEKAQGLQNGEGFQEANVLLAVAAGEFLGKDRQGSLHAAKVATDAPLGGIRPDMLNDEW